MRVGFIGTGVMGSRMVLKFLNAGYDVTVYNRTPEKLKPLLERGAEKADIIADAVRHSEIVCTCLSMPKDSLAVYTQEDGVLEHARPGTICLDFSTVDAATSREINKQASAKGIEFLDAPVSGGPEGVEAGTLTIMVGGNEEAFEKAKPLLEKIGETVEYLGPSGSGSIAKLINQYLVAVHSVAASEAMVAGAANGLAADKLYRLLKVSYGNSHILRRHMEQYVLDRQFEPGGAVKYVHKDIHLANKLFSETGLDHTLGQLAEQSFADAIQKGYADLDMSAVILPLEEKCNVTVQRKREK